MLARWKIRTRIHLLLALAAFGFFASAGIGLWSLHSQMQEDRERQLRDLLDLTLSVARSSMTAAGGPSTPAGRKAFLSTLQAARFGDAREANGIFAFDYNGVALAHADFEKIGRDLSETTDANGLKPVQTFIQIAKSPAGTGFTTYLPSKGPDGPTAPKLTLVQNVPEIGGLASVGVPVDDLNAGFDSKLAAEGGILLVLLLGLAAAAYLIGQSISKPLSDLATNAVKLGKGKLNGPLADAAEKTELGEIARVVDFFRNKALEQRDLQERLNAAANRERTRQQHFEDGVRRVQTAVAAAIATLRKQAEQLRAAATTLSEAAETATFEAAAAAHVSANAAGHSNAVAAATEQLSCSMREFFDRAHRTNAVVEAATHEAKRTNKDVASLASAAEEIGSFVAVIRGIAEQTNLLALNATIEAARAGESGRGFAVVAAEVKDFAAQTAKATDAIAGQIQAIQSGTSTAVSALQSVAGKVAEIQSFTGTIAAAVEEQTAAAQQIASTVSLAVEGSQKAAKSSGEISQIAGKTKQQAASLWDVSLQMDDATSGLAKALKDFLAAACDDLNQGRTRPEAAPVPQRKSEVLEAA